MKGDGPVQYIRTLVVWIRSQILRSVPWPGCPVESSRAEEARRKEELKRKRENNAIGRRKDIFVLLILQKTTVVAVDEDGEKKGNL